MSVYIDAAMIPYGRMLMSHLIADTPEELRDMANIIGVQLKWFQRRASAPHFDVCKAKRAIALRAGAIEVPRAEYVAVLARIRQTWPRDERGWVLPC